MIHVGIAEYLGSVIPGTSLYPDLVYSASGGANVFVDDLPTEPDVAVGVYIQPGPEADSKLPYDSPGVQIQVRGTSDPTVGLTLWWAIYSELHALRNVTLPDGTYLVSAIAEQSSPVRMGADGSGRQVYGMNLRTEIINRTRERP
jgi:hypothetical protein